MLTTTSQSATARSWIEWGLLGEDDFEDDFDAMVALLSMLKIVTEELAFSVPNDSAVHATEGRIPGLPCTARESAFDVM